jgi:phosphoribosylanthranilate isomerase
MSRVRVKVCGVVDPANACRAVEMGADFLGLNFYPPSPRFLTVERAGEIAAAVRDLGDLGRPVSLVGVFVDLPADEMEEIADRVGLDLLQLSGDETPESAARLAPRAIKAFRHGGDPGREALAAWDDAWGVLFDAPHGSLYGGTGAAWSYAAVRQVGASGRRVFVAGGIGPDNVRQAIAASGPWAVDVCSRVESSPGLKDLELLRRLFEEVRNAESPTPP